MRSILIKTLAMFATVLFLGLVAAQAATLTVDNTADSGPGTLRQALTDATFNAEANDILFNIPTTDPGYDSGTNRFTILLTSELPSIPVAATTITNAQPQAVTITGNGQIRIFTLDNGAAVLMNNITISNGYSGPLLAPNKTMSRARSAKLVAIGESYGGGIYMGSSSTLTLNAVVISNNVATFLGGGIYMSGDATLHAHYSSMTGNSANHGGAIFMENGGTLNIDTSTLNGNIASGDGGAGGGAVYVGWTST
ncbi:MAG: hypothetical protein ABJA02_01145, partial [Acidobacteriota bacterium]